MHLCAFVLPFGKKFKVRAHYFKLNVNSMFHSRHESRGSIIIVIMTFAIRMHKAMRRCCIYGRAQPTTPIHTIYLCFAKRSQTIPNSKVRFTLMRCLTHQNWKQKKKMLDDFIITVGVIFLVALMTLALRHYTTRRKSIACESKHKCVETLTSHGAFRARSIRPIIIIISRWQVTHHHRLI